MRSLKSGLIAIALASLAGTLAVVGCSADGGGSGLDTTGDPTDPGPGATLPPSVDSGYTSKEAGSKKDAGPKAEAGVDAGPPPPVEGEACSTPNVTVSKSCGACGKEDTLCISGDDSGAGTWGPYGTCHDEMVDGCIPGTTQACGNCGTQTCSKYCGWGACTGQPAGACAAGTVDYTTASCTDTNTYRARTCSATCAWGNYAATCSAATTPNKMTIPGTVGGLVTAKWTLAGNTLRPSLSCPGTVTASSSDGPFAAVEVANPSSTKAATVTIYQSKSPTGLPNLDMVLWTYAGNNLPLTNAALGACVDGVEDDCSGTADSNPCGNTEFNFYFAALETATIPAGGKILVYSGLYDGTDAVGDGTFNLTIKTTQLQ